MHHIQEINSTPLGKLPLAQAYTPMQVWGDVFTPEEGTRKGTAFPCLDMPYESRWSHA